MPRFCRVATSPLRVRLRGRQLCRQNGGAVGILLLRQKICFLSLSLCVGVFRISCRHFRITSIRPSVHVPPDLSCQLAWILEERTFGCFQRLHRLISCQTSRLSENLPSFLLFGIAFGVLSIIFHNVPRYHPGRRLPVEISGQSVTEQSLNYTATATTSHCKQVLRHVSNATLLTAGDSCNLDPVDLSTHPSLGCGL